MPPAEGYQKAVVSEKFPPKEYYQITAVFERMPPAEADRIAWVGRPRGTTTQGEDVIKIRALRRSASGFFSVHIFHQEEHFSRCFFHEESLEFLKKSGVEYYDPYL